MFNFGDIINLPLIWGGIISTAILLYVLLDGFDLGVGILFPFAPTDSCRDKMMNSIAPFWDGNETWLVLGGGGLFAAFPIAYGIVMPALYIPIIIMLVALIFRGVAFEFRYKSAGRHKVIWGYVFHFGSLLAAFAQGLILGGFLQGIAVNKHTFVGGPFDWLTAFSMLTGLGVVAGYSLLGSTWVIMKTSDKTQRWAKKAAVYALFQVLFFMAIVTVWVPFIKDEIMDKWFGDNNFYYVAWLPLLSVYLAVRIYRAIQTGKEVFPFIASIALYLTGFIGLAYSLWPYVVPYVIPLSEAAAADVSLSLMLVGVVFTLPIILAYTGYCYYTFRGKATEENLY